MEKPEINSRIRQIIDNKSNGSVKKFAEIIGVSQQKLNRLFNIDTRTQKFPTVSIDILVNITEMFVEVNPRWLLTGEGKMIIETDEENPQTLKEPEVHYESSSHCECCEEKEKVNQSLERVIEEKDKRLRDLERTIDILQGQTGDKSKRNSA